MKNKMMENKELLIYLHHKYKGKQSLIFKEILEKNLAKSGEATPEKIGKWIIDNNINTKQYQAFFEIVGKEISNIDPTHPILIRKLRKPRENLI